MLVATLAAFPAAARPALDDPASPGGADDTAGAGGTPSGFLECVPYARRQSGIAIYGDAQSWWQQARGRYATGHTPRVGAVMAMPAFGNSRLGHVATVSRIIDSRTILVSHANWSVPGAVEENVAALDVSPMNDWSEVRIWYAPIGNLGSTHWPVDGFIYNRQPAAAGAAAGATTPAAAPALASAPPAGRPAPAERTRRRSDPIGAIIAGRY